MLSIDTNILLFAFSDAAPESTAAREFLLVLSGSDDVALSEFVLTELYILLRNPAVLDNPLSARDAVGVIQKYRSHPRWQIVGFPPDSQALHNQLWSQTSAGGHPRRSIFDARLALTLHSFGIREFATANVKDFENLGFSRVWNPLLDHH